MKELVKNKIDEIAAAFAEQIRNGELDERLGSYGLLAGKMGIIVFFPITFDMYRIHRTKRCFVITSTARSKKFVPYMCTSAPTVTVGVGC